jgi:hypothetical protein
MNELVYKYLHDYGLKFLANLKLKVSIPDKLDDPFELRPRVGNMEVTPKHVEEFLRLDSRMAELYKTQQRGVPMEEWIKSYREDAARFDREFRAAVTPDTFDIYCQGSTGSISREYGMICFSKTFDDILMWSHYADKHRGIVIGFVRTELESILKARALDVNCRKERVAYDTEQFVRPGSKYVTDLLTTKSESWQYQKEVRYVMRLSRLPKPNCRRQILVKMPATSIRRILLGCCFPRSKVTYLNRLLERNRISVSPEFGRPHASEFTIEFKFAS